MDWKQETQGLLQDCYEELTKLKRKALNLAIFRGLFFTAAALVSYLLFPSVYLWFWVIGSILLFLWMMKLQAAVRNNRDEKEALVYVLQRELGEIEAPLPYEPEPNLRNHPLAGDLDLFGKFSLFESIQRTFSNGSARLLAEKLCVHPQDQDRVLSEQTDAKKLSGKYDKLYDFLAFSKLASFSGKEETGLNTWKQQSIKRTPGILMVAGPVLVFLSVLLVAMDYLPESAVLLILSLNLGFVLKRNKEIMALHKDLGKIHPSVQKISIQLAVWRKELALEEEAEQLREREEALKELARIMAKLDSRLNPFGAILFNGLFLYDLQTLNQLSEWQEKHAGHLEEWLNDLYSWELRANRALYYFRNGGVFPAISKSEFEISFEKLRHPLMDSKKAVPNSWSMKQKTELHILTGSNMSGKSTFLRSVGTSLCLAHNGFPVPAESYVFTPLQLVSSIRVSDNLSEEASYFYSEIKRIAEIIKSSEKEPRLFFLMDEILRGTNSADKQTGSRAILMRLKERNANGILATHDLSLTSMEEEFPEAIKNYAFESQERGDDLYFDYTLKRGVCEHLNAVFLMTKMGLIR